MEKNILVIGIAGGTGSGKTTLMKNLIQRYGDSVCVLSHDNYYRRLDHLTYEERCKINYDEPAALETDLMAHHLDLLRHRGSSVGRFLLPLRSFPRSEWFPTIRNRCNPLRPIVCRSASV